MTETSGKTSENYTNVSFISRNLTSAILLPKTFTDLRLPGSSFLLNGGVRVENAPPAIS